MMSTRTLKEEDFIMRKTMKCFAAAAAAAVFGASSVFAASASSWLEPGLGGGSTTSPSGPVFSYASDFSVWANGRDIKDDKKTPYVDETARYKTGEIQHIAMSTGGKWNVAVTDSTVSTVSQFLNMFDSKGKFTDPNAKETKQIASAKIKDGTITVTGGKKAGRVNVWVYEINQKQVIYLPQYSVAPRMYAAEVKMSAGSPVLAEEGSFTYRVLNKGAKAVSKLTLAYNEYSRTAQEPVTLELGDKKETPDMTTSYTVDYKNADKTTDASVVRVRISADNSTVTVTPVGVGKSTVSIINTQSGKAAKLTVEVKPMRRVIFDNRYVTVDDVTDKNAPVALYSGDSVIEGGSILVTAAEGAEVDEIQIGGKPMKSGGTYKVSGEDVEVIAGKTYSVTITGADKNNTVQSGGKSIKSGVKFLSGTTLTLTLGPRASASVETGGRTTRYYSSADLTVNGDMTIEITVPEQSSTRSAR